MNMTILNVAIFIYGVLVGVLLSYCFDIVESKPDMAVITMTATFFGVFVVIFKNLKCR